MRLLDAPSSINFQVLQVWRVVGRRAFRIVLVLRRSSRVESSGSATGRSTSTWLFVGGELQLLSCLRVWHDRSVLAGAVLSKARPATLRSNCDRRGGRLCDKHAFRRKPRQGQAEEDGSTGSSSTVGARPGSGHGHHGHFVICHPAPAIMQSS